MANEILQYTSKDFNSIKSDLLSGIDSLTDSWTSRDDGDPGIVLVNLMSAMGDMLSYNMDKQSLEYYAPTVTQRKNAYKLFELIGYQMHWFRSARTQVTIKNIPNSEMMIMFNDYMIAPTEEEKEQALEKYNNKFKKTVDGILCGYIRYNNEEAYWSVEDGYPEGNAVNIFNQFKLDNNAVINTYINVPYNNLTLSGSGSNGLLYTIYPTTITGGEYPELDNQTEINTFEEKKFNAVQGYLCSTTFNRTQMRENRYYIPDIFIDEDCMFLGYSSNVDITDPYKVTFITKVDNLLTYVNDDPEEEKAQVHFQFRADEFDRPYIELSNYWETVIGQDAAIFKFFYIRTSGKSGNITKNYLNTLANTGSNRLIITNKDCRDYLVDDDGNKICSPGYDIQTAQDAYKDSINYIMTYDTIVTIYDFARLAKRQGEVTNATAIDCQYASDLNKEISDLCQSYTKSQLLDILGCDEADETVLRSYLYNIRKVNYDYKDNSTDGSTSSNITPFKPYGINIYPVCYNFDGIRGAYQFDNDDKAIAEYGFSITDKDDPDTQMLYSYPYKMYRIFCENDVVIHSIQPRNNKIEEMLDTEYDKRRIVNVKPEYTAVRVFEWRCCGTIHLTKTVSETEAKNIIRNVINNLTDKFDSSKVEFGQKISYMDVISAILESDSRINYFDAGIGSNKLITYTQPPEPNNYFNIEAYFNPESIMRYVQTFEDNNDETSQYYNMIMVDPSYIQRQG